MNGWIIIPVSIFALVVVVDLATKGGLRAILGELRDLGNKG